MQANPTDKEKAIIEEMRSITTMERGKLTKAYRTRPAPDGKGSIRLGPYYKLQAWENDRNCTRYVTVDEVPALERDLANHKCFKELSKSFEDSVVARTRALRAQEKDRKDSESLDDADSKKNSGRKRGLRNSSKPKASSPKPSRD